MRMGMRVGLTEQTLNSGVFSLATARITADKIKPQAANLTHREQQVLDAAAKLANPGEPVSPTALASRLGIGRNHVGLVIGKLRAKGVWPHAPSKRGRQAGVKVKPVVKAKAVPAKTASEPVDILDVIKAVCDQLRPLDEADRKKVLDCVAVVLLPKV
jgi:biotin operon repressor